MRQLLRFIGVLAIILILLAVVGGLRAAKAAKLDPITYVRDAVSGFQSGADRHRNAQPLASPWDPVGDVNRRAAAIPLEDRAYPLLAEAAAMLEAADVAGLLKRSSDESGWDETVDWLGSDEARAIIILLEAAAMRPSLGAPLSDAPDPIWQEARARHGLTPDTGAPSQDPSPLDVLMPFAGANRDAARLLRADAEAARIAGQTERMLARIETAAKLVPMCSGLDTLIEQLVGYACVALITHQVSLTLRESPVMLDADAASRLAAVLDGLDRGGLLVLSARSEAVIIEDQLRRLVDANGVFLASAAAQVSSTGSAIGLPPPSSVEESAINQQILEAIHRSRAWASEAEAATQPVWEPMTGQASEIQAFVDEPSGIPGKIARLIVGIAQPSWSAAVRSNRRINLELDGLRVALAAHRHHLRHGMPPSSLDAIDPDLLNFEPVDGFTGGRLVYRWTGDAHLVYALGSDQDDDGGRHASDPLGEPVKSISDEYLEGKWDGDWLLFPPRE